MKTKLLIFGVTGDLGRHRLVPALEKIIGTGDFDDLSIIGVSRHDVDVQELLVSCQNKDIFNEKLSVFTMDVANSDEYVRLKDYLALEDDEQLIVYLAVPPVAVREIIDHLGESGLNNDRVKILFEKPFGTNLISAQEIANHTSKYFNDQQIYRIDHYLAKEMAQNLITIRSKNALFSQIWQSDLISSISIIALETVDIEGRANFYEQTGALRDIVQGHLMQLLALTLSDVSENLDWDKLPKLRSEALNKLSPADPQKSVRAQYEGYKAEVNNPDSQVETFVCLNLESNDSKWQNVPIRLITGKSLDRKTTEIRVHIKKTDQFQSNCLVFSIQPNEGVGLELLIKKPGYGNELEMRRFGFNYPDESKLPDAYERVIVDAIQSRKSLFTSSEEVLQSWKVLQPLLDYWESETSPIKTYPKGSHVDSILA